MAKYIMIASVFLATVLVNQANALKCWRCSSDASGAAFCQDPFETDLISEQQKRWSFVDCSLAPSQQYPSTYSQSTRPVCKKMKQIINDKVVISRSCSWEDINSSSDSCMRQNTPSYIRTEFCETCTYDGCNGAGQWGPVALLIALPVLIAKLLAH